MRLSAHATNIKRRKRIFQKEADFSRALGGGTVQQFILKTDTGHTENRRGVSRLNDL